MLLRLELAQGVVSAVEITAGLASIFYNYAKQVEEVCDVTNSQYNQEKCINYRRLADLFMYIGLVNRGAGTRIRMNAKSRLSYPLRKGDSTVVNIKGEAYVDASNRYESTSLIIGTEKGNVTATRADFLIRSDTGNMKTMLNARTMQVYSHHLHKVQPLVCPGDFVYVGARYADKNQDPRDTMGYVADQDFNEAKMWTRKIRVYKNMPLLVFVGEISRWEGFTIKKWDCIPKDSHISVSSCY